MILHVVRRCKILQLVRHCKTKNQFLKIMCEVVRFCWCWGGCSSWPASWRGSLNIWLHVTWDERHRKTIFGPVNLSSGSQSSNEFQMFQVRRNNLKFESKYMCIASLCERWPKKSVGHGFEMLVECSGIWGDRTRLPRPWARQAIWMTGSRTLGGSVLQISIHFFQC